MKDAKVEVKCEVKSVSTSAMLGLPLTTSTGVGGSGPRGSNLPPGSPLSTPDVERPPVNMSICEKCDKDIQKVILGDFLSTEKLRRLKLQSKDSNIALSGAIHQCKNVGKY